MQNKCLAIIRFDTAADGIQHGLDTNIHADPVRAGTPVAIDATGYVQPFDAYVGRIRAAVAPPFRRTKDTDDGCTSRYSQVRGARVASHIHIRMFREFVKTFKRWLDRDSPA